MTAMGEMPELPAALDPVRALRAFRRTGKAAGSLAVSRVHFSARRPPAVYYLVDGRTWIAELAGQGATDHAARELRRLAKRGQLPDPADAPAPDPETGLVFRRAGLDTRLPGLKLLHDSDHAADLAAEALGEARRGRPAAVVLRAHRLAKRAVLEIRLDGATPVFARLKPASGDGAGLAWERHLAVARALHGNPAIRIPAPLRFDESLSAAFFGALTGVPLSPGAKPDAARAVAAALTAFRRIDGSGWARWDRDDEIALTRSWVLRVSALRPERATVLTGALDAAGEALQRLPARPPVSCHRDVHEDQILLDGASGTAGLLDFDTVRLSDPALDLGNLVAHLRLAAWRQSCGHDLERALLDSASDAGRVAPWTAIALLRLCCIHAFTPEGPRLAPALLDCRAAA